jgi:hypothetical protein
MQIISIPASSGSEHVPKIPQDIPWGFCFTDRSKKLQEKHLEVQFNSQDVFGYILGFNYTSKDKAFTILNVAKLSTFEYQVTDVWHWMNHSQKGSLSKNIKILSWLYWNSEESTIFM